MTNVLEPPQLVQATVIDGLVKRMASISSLEEAFDILDELSVALGVEKTIWVPDISQPYFCDDVDAFMRRQAWPSKYAAYWWERNVTLKMPYYIRCRFEHLPFAIDVTRAGAIDPETFSSHEFRTSLNAMESLGIRSIYTIPLHLPKGQIALLAWADGRSPAMLSAAFEDHCGRLLAIGHYLMSLYRTREGGQVRSREERARLTPREWDCLRLTAQGYREAEVAKLTGISATTARYHLDNVVRKLGTANRTHAVALAAQLGMLGPIGA